MNNNYGGSQTSQLLMIVLGVLLFILFILFVVFITIKIKQNGEQKKTIKRTNKKSVIKDNINYKSYSKEPIMNFMDFQKVEDNMIIQKNGRRFLMVIECQGVNYDLMSKIEKTSVEEGFQQFLNTLRQPIQIYIQTRSVNLENSIMGYQGRIKEVQAKYDKLMGEYNQMKRAEVYSQEELNKVWFEIVKQKNLLEYGQDIVENTKRMSLNKAVLNKRYFVIVPYTFEEDIDKYGFEEIKNMAFSELYTKSQALNRTLAACSVNGKILNSESLIELLYIAYNRDEAEVFSVQKAIKSGFDEIYSTAPNVLEKKIKILDEMIEEKSIELAEESIKKAKSRLEKKAEEKEENMIDIIKEYAETILNQNKDYVEEDVLEEATKIVKETKVKRRKVGNEKKKTTGK